MALSINDVIALANAGFSKTDIVAFMNLGNPQTTPPSPVQVPGATAPTVPTAPATVPTPAPAQQAPATPDLGQLVASLADLSKRLTRSIFRPLALWALFPLSPVWKISFLGRSSLPLHPKAPISIVWKELLSNG